MVLFAFPPIPLPPPLFLIRALQVPNYLAWVNCLRCSLAAILSWVTLHLCVLTFVADYTFDETLNEYVWTNYDQRRAGTVVRNATCKWLASINRVQSTFAWVYWTSNAQAIL